MKKRSKKAGRRRAVHREPVPLECVVRVAEQGCDAVGRMLHLARRKLGLTLDEAATGADISRQCLSKIERGLCWPLLVTILRICASYRMTLLELAMRLGSA